ncbi:hypothetical protein A3731_10715 [Roseovarius sp. HI0049]|nr:hypothetical protein A3731_10715 [Roseovarius sp. HI0049]
MTIFSGKKLVFYAHVPKTGGTYVEDLFVANGYTKRFWTSSPKRDGLKVSYQHFERQRYETCLQFKSIDYAFITVRHPIDRLLSEYRNSGKDQDVARWVVKVRNALTRDPCFLDNHFQPQIAFYRPPMQIFRQEARFNEQWARELSADHELGFETFTTKAKRDTRAKERTLSYAEACAVVQFCLEYYRRDFEVFGYDVMTARTLQELDEDTKLRIEKDYLQRA